MRKPCGRTSRKSLWWKVLDDLLKLSNRLTNTLLKGRNDLHVFWLEELMEVGLMIAPTSRWSSMISFPDVFLSQGPSEKDVRKWRAPTNSIDFATQLDLSKRNLGGNALEITISVAPETGGWLLCFWGPGSLQRGGVHRIRGFFIYAPSFSKQFLQSLPTTQKISKKISKKSPKCFPQMSIVNNSR